MNEWQSIESVPKDGRAVVLCWAIDADGRPINWAETPESAGVFVQVASWWQDEIGGEGDWIVYCGMVREPSLHFEPTHWMPLPDPPKT